MELQGAAIAHPNIALVKYWGKRDAAANVPATSSLSITLDSLRTRTTVLFAPGLTEDRVQINGRSEPAQSARVSSMLNVLRNEAGVDLKAEVLSSNDFPTGAGLASSASGFAALVTAACTALGLPPDPVARSRLARRGSASAARSIFGGFVELHVDRDPDPAARPLLAADQWPLHVVVAVTAAAAKPIGSTAGMNASAATSDFYGAWVDSSVDDFIAAREAVLARDFDRLAEVGEANCLKMHGVMLSTRPALIYWNAATLAVMHRVRALRAAGVPVFFTIDAGPQVKAVCLPDYRDEVIRAVREVPGVIDLLDSRLGEGARVIATAPAP